MADEIVVGPTRPPDPQFKIGPGPAGATGKPPTGCAPLSGEDFHPQLHNIAVKLLKGEWGALTSFRIGDKYYMARVEPHFRKPSNDPQTIEKQRKHHIPVGWHKGVSVFKVLKTVDKPTVAPQVAKTEYYTPSKPMSGRTQFLDRLTKLLSDMKIV